ncbi:BTB/POZ domain-containing protein [Phanerochaete sordida]|uniref:BTB/POZ domain-containing protein n=1 Tax=Phanerochaete sordida TaxID=48140 RepID=A0A9P3G9H3_9APHY|nr:BTB/POZ domain-containing protein [Phanerochaete sordida]
MPASTRSLRSADGADMPNKRRKVEPDDDEESALRGVELGDRAEHLWFEDGNVILAARGMSFRVHKGILALRSDVFRTMLDDASREQVEGRPVFRVEDQGKDLRDLLHIIYNGGNSDWLSSSRPTIEYADFRRVVDIALKYNINEVISEAKYRLSRVFQTDSLENWDSDLSPDGDQTPLSIYRRDCIDLLPLSRRLGMHSILPLVFYTCCNVNPVEKLAHGVQLDGVPKRVYLAPNDLALCLKGRESLSQESSRIMRVLHELASADRAPSERCTMQARCRKAFLILSLFALDKHLYFESSVLVPMDDWLDDYEEQPNARPCRHCDAVLRKRMDDRRKAVWCKLGEIFGSVEWPAGKKDNVEGPASNNILE